MITEKQALERMRSLFHEITMATYYQKPIKKREDVAEIKTMAEEGQFLAEAFLRNIKEEEKLQICLEALELAEEELRK